MCGAWATCKNLSYCDSLAKNVLCIFAVASTFISPPVLSHPPSVQVTCVMQGLNFKHGPIQRCVLSEGEACMKI